MSGQSKQRLYAIVIRARDLPRMRRFYAETAGLGEPVIDSNFWVEFQDEEGTQVLALVRAPNARAGQEAAPEKAVKRGERPVLPCLAVDDLQHFRSRLDEHHVSVLGTVRLPSGARGVYFPDPEGNMVLAVERCPRSEQANPETQTDRNGENPYAEST